MVKYIAKVDKIVSCIYGTRPLVKGKEVDEFIAKKFPQYIDIITIDDKPKTVEDFEIYEDKQSKRKEKQ